MIYEIRVYRAPSPRYAANGSHIFTLLRRIKS